MYLSCTQSSYETWPVRYSFTTKVESGSCTIFRSLLQLTLFDPVLLFVYFFGLFLFVTPMERNSVHIRAVNISRTQVHCLWGWVWPHLIFFNIKKNYPSSLNFIGSLLLPIFVIWVSSVGCQKDTERLLSLHFEIGFIKITLTWPVLTQSNGKERSSECFLTSFRMWSVLWDLDYWSILIEIYILPTTRKLHIGIYSFYYV